MATLTAGRMMPTWFESRNAACTARRDLVESEPLTTAEILRSEDL